jgi:3-methyladenine DNA glycosylase AlkD
MIAAKSIATCASVIAELKKRGKEQTRATYVRHGAPPERVLGVSAADAKVIAKWIRGKQALAYELYDTGIQDAMYLAGLVADGSEMTSKQLQDWAEAARGLSMISEHTVPWVTVENAHARELAIQWIQSEKEHLASCGWNTYAGLVAVTPDDSLYLKEIERLLGTITKDIAAAPNRVRYTMNGFVISVGSYVKPLLKQAKAAAKEIGTVYVDVGDTACKVPLATAYIEKVEAASRVGQKRKTVR